MTFQFQGKKGERIGGSTSKDSPGKLTLRGPKKVNKQASGFKAYLLTPFPQKIPPSEDTQTITHLNTHTHAHTNKAKVNK